MLKSRPFTFSTALDDAIDLRFPQGERAASSAGESSWHKRLRIIEVIQITRFSRRNIAPPRWKGPSASICCGRVAGFSKGWRGRQCPSSQHCLLAGPQQCPRKQISLGEVTRGSAGDMAACEPVHSGLGADLALRTAICNSFQRRWCQPRGEPDAPGNPGGAQAETVRGEGTDGQCRPAMVTAWDTTALALRENELSTEGGGGGGRVVRISQRSCFPSPFPHC